MHGDDRPAAGSPFGDSLAEAVLAALPQPVLVLNELLEVERVNSAFLRTFRVTADETVGRPVYELGTGQWGNPELQALLAAVIPADGRVEDFRVDHAFEHIGRRVMLLSARRLEGEGQRPPLILLAMSDCTALEDARYQLQGQTEYAEKIIDSLREALLVMDWELRVRHANLPFYDKFGVSRAETEGRLIYDLGNGQWNIPRLRELLEDILPKETSIDDFEVRHTFERIGERTMLLNARRLDHLNLILLAIEDITERQEAMERQHMLTSELSHRVKNVLALVDSLASQTLAKSRSLRDFGEAFHGRIRTVARAHGRLFASEWTQADLEELVRETLDGCAIDFARVKMTGEPVIVPPDHAMALNLTVHELCTNAVKYGALSVPAGVIELGWSVERREGARWIRLGWRESGGPRVRSPRRKGYGTRLIETLCPYELEGEIDLQFRPEGLVCELVFPLD